MVARMRKSLNPTSRRSDSIGGFPVTCLLQIYRSILEMSNDIEKFGLLQNS